MEHSLVDWSILAVLTGPAIMVALEILARIERGLDELTPEETAKVSLRRTSRKKEGPTGA